MQKNASTNHELLSSWVNEYVDQLYSWAYHKTSSKEMAEDLVQETFFAATKSLGKCADINQPKSWLFAILNKKIIDYYRKSASKFNQSFSSYEVACTQATESLFDSKGNWKNFDNKLFPSNDENLLDNPEFNKIWSNCLENLPKNWRFAILSKYIFEKKGEDICKELNITSSNYWQMVHRAKLLLKVCVSKHWDI